MLFYIGLVLNCLDVWGGGGGGGSCQSVKRSLEVVASQDRLTSAHPFSGLDGNVFLTTHSTHFIYGYMASDIW